MKNKIIIVIILLVFFTGFTGLFLKFYKHESNQNKRILLLENEITNLKFKSNKNVVEWISKDYNYLAIGNSITIHSLADYWWDNDRGMASTCDENDYVHRVTKFLEDNNKAVHTEVVGFSIWETMFTDRAETLENIDGYLSNELNLITIQLGENVSELDNFSTDFQYLIRYIANKAQNAQIIVVGDFWEYKNRNEIKRNVAENENVTFVSLDNIINQEEYQAGMGTVVYDDTGNVHVINHKGVALHPGDKGMKAIAELIIDKIIKREKK